MRSDKCRSKEAEKDMAQMPLSHICNRLPFTSDYYGALVLSSLCPAAHQGPHQGMPLPNIGPPIRGPSSDKQDKQVQFLAGLIKDSMLSPWPISSRHKNQTQMRSHGNQETNPLSLYGHRKQKGQCVRGWGGDKAGRQIPYQLHPSNSMSHSILWSYPPSKNKVRG